MACSNYTMSGIASACKDSIGGVKEIYVALRGAITLDLSAEPVSPATWSANDVYIEDGVLHLSEAEMIKSIFKKYEVRRATSSATSTLQVSENAGNSWQTELALQFMKQDAAKRAEVMALVDEGTAVIFIDSNDEAWFMGWDYAVEASAATAESGTALGDLNGYNLTLMDQSKELPYRLADADVTALKASYSASI